MELEKNTKNELKNLLNVPKIEITDEAVENIVSILNKDPIFSGIIKPYRSQRKFALSVDTATLALSYNIDKLKSDVEWRYNKQAVFGLTLEDYYHYYLAYSIFHETTHIDQINKGFHNLYPYPDLNNAYYQAFAVTRKRNIIDFIRYLHNHPNFFYERNADVNAAKLSAEIFDDEKLFLYGANLYLNFLFNDAYSLKGNRVISPVEKTMKYLHQKDFTTSDHLPFDVAFEHGFPISLEEYHYLFDYIDEVKKGSAQAESQDINELMHHLILAREEAFKNK